MSSESRVTWFGLLLLFSSTAVRAQRPSSVGESEAAALAFPGCKVVREVVTLSRAQRARIAKDAAVPRVSEKVVRYVAYKGRSYCGAAYVDVRRVRSRSQKLLVAVDREGRAVRTEILSWGEPSRYRLRAAFWKQFRGRKLDAKLRLRRGVRPVTGATLSARAAVDAVRTLLAVDRALSASKVEKAKKK